MPKKYRQFTINFQPRFLWTELMSHAWLLFQKRSCRNLMTKDFPFKNSSYCVRLSSLHAERKDGQFLWFAGRRTNTKIKRFQKKKTARTSPKTPHSLIIYLDILSIWQFHANGRQPCTKVASLKFSTWNLEERICRSQIEGNRKLRLWNQVVLATCKDFSDGAKRQGIRNCSQKFQHKKDHVPNTNFCVHQKLSNDDPILLRPQKLPGNVDTMEGPSAIFGGIWETSEFLFGSKNSRWRKKKHHMQFWWSNFLDLDSPDLLQL